ncbi:hypothetical protein DND67_30885 [Pseudomonas syringae pv. pisi]|nr:hypothetical protein DND67_30885 [Pseudomonas syringae pv. pisi]
MYYKDGNETLYDIHQQWFYKCDDDSFVRVELLQEILRQFDYTKALYLGSSRRFQGKHVPVLQRYIALG